jgi:F0F1-type ATP synthase assembly protein I
MLWTIFLVLLVLWLLCMVSGVGGSMIYALPVVAAVVLVYILLSSRQAAT